jgi:galactose mutarotase-like enzyme
MNVVEDGFQVRHEQGFAVYVLRNAQVEAAVVPDLGGRIISLKHVQTGREWLWHPAGGLKLFRNRPGDDFARSPLAGIDECLPTVAPCSWQGRQLPDHGEVWTASWEVDRGAWERGVLKTRVELPVSPFVYHRTIELKENELRLSYRLDNRGNVEEKYLWTMHPLLQLRADDRLELPASTRALMNEETWIDAVDSAVPHGGCAKVFGRPLSEGVARIVNRKTGDCLGLEWNPDENNTLGLWLTRGGWHGHDHFALEPTNGDDDALTVAADRGRCGTVPASGAATWQITFQVGPRIDVQFPSAHDFAR